MRLGWTCVPAYMLALSYLATCIAVAMLFRHRVVGCGKGCEEVDVQ